MNVTDLREKLRRSPINRQPSGAYNYDRRKVSDRRTLSSESGKTEANVQRIWLTPGERTLIEDLYLLDDN
jgi:hypothetical protein